MRNKLPKIDLYALCILSIEEKGEIDTIFPPESFMGDFFSFSSFSEDLKPFFLLEGVSFPIYPKNIIFKNQPIGLFIDENPTLLRALDKRTKIFYSQDFEKNIIQKEADYFSNLKEKDIEKKFRETSFLKTDYSPYFPIKKNKERLSIIFENNSKNTFTIWLPTPIYSFWKKMLKNFIENYYPNYYIELKSTPYQIKDINASLLAHIIIQLAERGLFYKKNIHLEVNIKDINKGNFKASIKSYKEEEFNKIIFHEISLKIPYSIRWKKDKITGLIKSFFLNNLNIPKINLSISYFYNYPIFITSIEEILYPLNDLLEQHFLKHFDDVELNYYDHLFKGKEKDIFRFKEKNDYNRRRFSYKNQDIFPSYKLISRSKKGIGLSFFYFNELLEIPNNREWNLKIEENSYKIKAPFPPLYSSTLKIVQEKANLKKISNNINLTKFYFENLIIDSPIFRESVDFFIDLYSPNDNKRDINRVNNSKYMVGCCLEIKSEPWVSQIQITNLNIVLGSGKKNFLEEEKDRLIAIAQNFFQRKLPENIAIIKNWESTVNLTILEEGEGSFIYFPYALRNAFYSALLQTGLNTFPSLYLK